MVNKEFLSMMKSDACLINTSRGSVVNETDLLEKLEECQNFWFATDVFNGEPSQGAADFDHPIAKHPRV
jgi:glycerate dehydrogenase